MLDQKYCEYAKLHGGIQLAALQSEFKLNYKEAKNIVDSLVSAGFIVYDSGLDYKYVKPVEQPRRPLRQYAARRRGYIENFDNLEQDEKIKDFFKRLRAELEEADNDDEDEDFLTALDDDEDYENLDLDFLSVLDDDDETEPDIFPDFEDNREFYEKLHALTLKLIEVKSQPVSAYNEPDHSLWQGDNFDSEVFTRIEKLVLTDKKMGLKGAIKKAETYLEAVRDTHDRKMVQLYENIVYRLKSTTSYQYNLVKKYLFNPD